MDFTRMLIRRTELGFDLAHILEYGTTEREREEKP